MVTETMLNWLATNARLHRDSIALAEACAAAHGLVTVPYHHDDDTVEPVPFTEWTSPLTGEAHPLYDAAAEAHDAALSAMVDAEYDAWVE